MSDENSYNIEKLTKSVRDLLVNLTAEEAKILREKFGVDLSSNHTLEEVPVQLEVTQERIKQLEEKAMKKIARKKELNALPKCSFCKLRSDQVKRLIAAPDSNVFICDGCVKECLNILEE